MDPEYEHLHVLEEDTRDDSLKLIYLASLVKRYASFAFKKPRRRVTHMTLQLIPEFNTDEGRNMSISQLCSRDEDEEKSGSKSPDVLISIFNKSVTTIEDQI